MAVIVSNCSENFVVLASEGVAMMATVALSMAARRISSFVDPGMLNLEGCHETVSVVIVLRSKKFAEQPWGSESFFLLLAMRAAQKIARERAKLLQAPSHY